MIDPRAVIGIDRQHQAIEEAPTLRRRPGEQRIHRRRQPNDTHMIAKRARRRHLSAIDAVAALGRIPARARFPAGAQLVSLAVLLDFDRQGEAAGAADPHAFRELRAS